MFIGGTFVSLVLYIHVAAICTTLVVYEGDTRSLLCFDCVSVGVCLGFGFCRVVVCFKLKQVDLCCL